MNTLDAIKAIIKLQEMGLGLLSLSVYDDEIMYEHPCGTPSGGKLSEFLEDEPNILVRY